MPIKNNGKLKKTRTRGILEDGPNRFIVRARWPDPKTGKRMKRESVARTFEEAVALQSRLMTGLEATDHANVTRLRFTDYAEQWLKNHSAAPVASTSESYVNEIATIVTIIGVQ